MTAVSVEEGTRPGTFYFHSSDGYSFHYSHFMKGGRISLRCILYKKSGCRGRASVDSDGNAFCKGAARHNHDPDRNLRHVRRFRSAVLKECRSPDNAMLTLKTIFHNVRRSLRCPRDALVSMPFKKLRPAMHRARNSTLPNIPHSLSELAAILDDEDYSFLTKTLDGEDNIYLGKFGQTSERTRVIIFGSRRALEILRQVKMVFSDATFSSVPAALQDNCCQIWSIVALRRNHVLPLVRVLMQSKTQACYETALQAIRTAVPDFQPETVMADFETAQANAWESLFPLVILLGCLFHSSKAIAGKAKELGLTNLIRDNEEVDSLVRSLCALALLPPDGLMHDGLESIVLRSVQLGHWENLKELFQYVLTTWFSPSKMRMFSVFKCPDRTNNASESSNAALKAALRSDHPSVWFFLWYNASGPRRASALANDETIKGFYADLEQNFIDVGEFLKRASRRIQSVYNQILSL